MIAKAVKGTGFRGALEYDLNEEKGAILETNMSGSNARELAKEFGAIRKLRPNLNKAVLHVSLSAAVGEKLTNEQWQEIAQTYLKGMDLDNNQYVITRHTDTDHDHIHIVANRIQFSGEVTSDSQDYKRQEVIMRQIERDYNLQSVAPSADAVRRAVTKGEFEREKRTGEPSTKKQLQQLADSAAKDSKSYAEYAQKLQAAGVELVPVTQLEDTKLSGLSYKLDGVTMKGSDLGKGYSPAGLAKRGVVYEKGQAHATSSPTAPKKDAAFYADALETIKAEIKDLPEDRQKKIMELAKQRIEKEMLIDSSTPGKDQPTPTPQTPSKEPEPPAPAPAPAKEEDRDIDM
jgi:hypothetical protein